MPSNARQLLGLVLFAVFSLPFNASAMSLPPVGQEYVDNFCITMPTQQTLDEIATLYGGYSQIGIYFSSNFFSADYTLPQFSLGAPNTVKCYDLRPFFSVGDEITQISLIANTGIWGSAYVGNPPVNVTEVPTCWLNGGGACVGNISLFLIASPLANPSIASFSVIGSSTALETISNVGNATKATGQTLWRVVALAVALPLTFYAIAKVVLLFSIF
jgi:hypothetical protein